MEKDFVKKISVWEKVSDFLMDIAKYVLTAVIITSAFEGLSGVGWVMYLFCITGKINVSTKKGREWMDKFE